MKKYLCLMLAVCLLLAVSPAYAKERQEYEDILPGKQIRVNEINGDLDLKLWGYWDEESFAYLFEENASLPKSETLTGARVQIPYGESFFWMAPDTSHLNCVLEQQDLDAYGLTQAEAAGSLSDRLYDAVFYQKPGETKWRHFEEYSRAAGILNRVYSISFAYSVKGSRVGPESEASVPVKYDGETFSPVFLLPRSAVYRFFVVNGPEIRGTDYSLGMGILYDHQHVLGSEEDWSATFAGVTADKLLSVSFGGETLTPGSDYTVEQAGADIRLTLKGSFLKTLGESSREGYHKVDVSFEMPQLPVSAPRVQESLSAVLINVVAPEPETTPEPVASVPTTGDDSSLLLWSALLCVSVCMSAWMFIRSRRRTAK